MATVSSRSPVIQDLKHRPLEVWRSEIETVTKSHVLSATCMHTKRVSFESSKHTRWRFLQFFLVIEHVFKTLRPLFFYSCSVYLRAMWNKSNLTANERKALGVALKVHFLFRNHALEPSYGTEPSWRRGFCVLLRQILESIAVIPWRCVKLETLLPELVWKMRILYSRVFSLLSAVPCTGRGGWVELCRREEIFS